MEMMEMTEEAYVLQFLNKYHIDFSLERHEAVYTMEEMKKTGLDPGKEALKNLFVRDKSKKRYMLVVLPQWKNVNLKILRSVKQIARPIGFCSEKDLEQILHLYKGAVSPLGVIHDTENIVEIIVDKEVMDFHRVGIHPNVNTATIWMTPVALVELLRKLGKCVSVIDL